MKDYLRKRSVAKVISVLLILCFIGQIIINTNTDPKDTVYTHPFIDPVYLLLFAQLLLSPLIATRFGNIFWISKPHNKPIDERQLFQRRKIFEMSYIFVVIVMLVATYGLYYAKLEFVYANAAFLGLAFLLYSLPSIIATWREETV